MTNKYRKVLYIGVTSNLRKRIEQHRSHTFKGSFTDRYNVEVLVYYEGYNGIKEAIARENQLKGWSRKKKDYLVNLVNKNWDDLYDEVINDNFSLFSLDM